MKRVICMLLALLMTAGAACAEAPGNRLGFAVLHEMSDGTGNQVISPLSIAYAMSMAAEGARGETRQELLGALDAENTDDVAGLLHALRLAGMKQANAAFLPGEMVPEEEYQDVLSEKFGAEWFDAAESTADDINRWVSDATDGMIPEMVRELPAQVQLALINAIAMDAKWQIEFDPYCNTEDVFHAPDGEENVTYMNREFHARYGERENVQMLELKYRDCGLKMYIALPEAGGMEDVLEGLRAEGTDYFAFREDTVKVDLSMPKTDIAVTTPLTNVLQTLGMARAFSDEADFSGISEEEALKIDSVLQKTRFILDEEGTRAAAATMIAVADGAMLPIPEEIVEFRMDRPFAFVIMEETSGAVCFAGVVTDPTGN